MRYAHCSLAVSDRMARRRTLRGAQDFPENPARAEFSGKLGAPYASTTKTNGH
jgi:hypothetical protein